MRATAGASGVVATRAYDATGRLTQEAQVIDGLPFPVAYAYDPAGRQIRMTYPDGTVVDRPVTARGQVASVSMAGQALSRRTYDAAGRLVRQDLGNGVTEVRSYVPGDRLVARIAATAAAGTVITDFRYAYDANKRKLSEVDGVQASAGQSFGYDPQDRLTAWSQGQSGATASATQTWALTAVGDWAATTRNGVIETRTHTDVHEIASIDGTALTWDAKGNLLTAPNLPTLGWDVENRLISAHGIGPNGPVQASYAYDALGRRVQKTVNGVTTTWLSAGPQVVLEVTGRLLNAPWLNPLAPLITPPTPDLPTGAILAQSGPGVVRVNVQPGASATPDGWLADTGAAYGLHGDRTYGWSAALAATALVDRAILDEPTWDTTARMAAEDQAGSTWSIALPNGTYPVIVIMGDAASREHTNTVAINGAVQVDPTPWIPGAQIGYEQGSFDGYAVDVTVTNGRLTIAPVLGQSWNPSLCCVEIGAQGTVIDAATRERLADTVKRLTEATASNRGTTPTVVRTAYGSYVDEVVGVRRSVRGKVDQMLWAHVNHLYSVAVVTDACGIVAERYLYDAYGTQTITTPGGAMLTKSTVAFDRGFTGYISNQETGLMYARARMYSSGLGRFVGRDPKVGIRVRLSNYGAIRRTMVNGASQYRAYFIPTALDPAGMEVLIMIYTNVAEGEGDPGLIDGHAALAVIDTDAGTADTYGLWPDDHPGIERDGLSNGDGSDVRKNYPPDNPRGYKHRFVKKLTDAEADRLRRKLTEAVHWGILNNCSSFVSEVYEETTGEEIDADDVLGIETPRELGESIDEKNKEEQTGDSDPCSGSSSGSSK